MCFHGLCSHIDAFFNDLVSRYCNWYRKSSFTSNDLKAKNLGDRDYVSVIILEAVLLSLFIGVVKILESNGCFVKLLWT